MPSHSRPAIALLIDSKELRRAGIESLLSDWADAHELKLIGSSVDNAVSHLGTGDDYKIVVVSIGGQSIIDREVQQLVKVVRGLEPHVPIIVLSDRDDGQEVFAALGAGVRGFLPSTLNQQLALQAFTFIINGGSYFPPAALRSMPSSSDREDEPPPREGPSGSGGRTDDDLTSNHDDGSGDVGLGRGPSMTSRQREVLRFLKDGQPNKVIARHLGMTEATVKVHVRQIMRKLGAANRTQAALCAMSENGAHDPSGPAKASQLAGGPTSRTVN